MTKCAVSQKYEVSIFLGEGLGTAIKIIEKLSENKIVLYIQ